MIRVARRAWNNVTNAYPLPTGSGMGKVESNVNYSNWVAYGVSSDGLTSNPPLVSRFLVELRTVNGSQVLWAHEFDSSSYFETSGFFDFINHSLTQNFDVWLSGADYVFSECEDNADCPTGEKCVDGECVPCQKVVDGQGTLTLYGSHRVDGTLLADSYQGGWEGSNSHEFDLPNGTPYAGALVIPNGMQANLKISAYYGFFGASSWSKVVFDGPVNKQKVEFNYPPAGDLPFGCLYSAKVLVEVTNYVGLGDCADDLVEPEEPVAPEPPIIEEPETPVEPEPENPIDKEVHEGEPEEPVKPDKPVEPENCDCENYIAKSVQVGSDQIFDMLGSLKDSIDRLSNNLTKDVDRVSLSINQAANVNNAALSAINSNLYNLLMFLSEKMYTEVVQLRLDLKENLSCGDRGLACILEKAALKTVNHPVAGEIEVGLVDSVVDFAGKNIQESVEEIEPVHIENEFRVQSRRTENFIDES